MDTEPVVSSLATDDTTVEVLTFSLIDYVPANCNVSAILTESSCQRSVTQEQRYERKGYLGLMSQA